MIQKIIRSGNPILRNKSKPITKIDKKVKALVTDLKDTLSAQKSPEGVGLAAPQIGKNLRLFITKHKGFEKVVINPVILGKIQNPKRLKAKLSKKDDKNEILEGCLSLPHYYGPLKRAEQVKLKYKNENGDEVVEEFKDFNAQIILHEIDHLDGILFVDRLLEQKKGLYHLSSKDEWEEVELQ